MCVGFVQTIAGAAVPIMKKFELTQPVLDLLLFWFTDSFECPVKSFWNRAMDLDDAKL
jgi:hypothetical protein